MVKYKMQAIIGLEMVEGFFINKNENVSPLK
jgi:hypothetical protein